MNDGGRSRLGQMSVAGALAIALAVLVAGCATTVPPPSDGSATPATATPTTAPSTAGAPSPCPVLPYLGAPPSNTLVNMTVSADGSADRITFSFGPAATDPSGGTSRLAAVVPPFSQAGSGLPVAVLGSRFIELHLDGMLIADEAGNATYQGPTSLQPGFVAIRDIEETDGFEGVYNFVIGYDGNGCVELAEDQAAKTLTITIGH